MRATFFEIAGLIALGAGSRLLPHLPNMTAMNAIALKSRARFGAAGILIPLVGMIISDAVIGFYDWRLLLSVYASFALIGMLGALLRTASWRRVAGVSLLASILFFLITNAVVWAISPWYPASLTGLMMCYLAGLPFALSMLAGDLFFSLALFRGTSALRFCMSVVTPSTQEPALRFPSILSR